MLKINLFFKLRLTNYTLNAGNVAKPLNIFNSVKFNSYAQFVNKF